MCIKYPQKNKPQNTSPCCPHRPWTQEGKGWENPQKLFLVLIFLCAFIGVGSINLFHSFLFKKHYFHFFTAFFIFFSLFQTFQSWLHHLKIIEQFEFPNISGILIFLLALLFLRKIYKQTRMWIYLSLSCNLQCKNYPRIEVELLMAGSSSNGQRYHWSSVIEEFSRCWEVGSFLTSKTLLKTRHQGWGWQTLEEETRGWHRAFPSYLSLFSEFP